MEPYPLKTDAALGQPADTSQTIIVGCGGRLGKAFAFLWENALALGRENLNIRSREAVMRVIGELQPRLIINCAAMTDMQSCENDPDTAWAVNVRGVRNLAEAAKSVGATLVHFSSDYARNPVNEYAWTKLASEPLAHLTIRAKIYDGSHWAWRALRTGKSVKMSDLEYSNPITTTSVVEVTEKLLRLGGRGLVQMGTADRLSFFQIGELWAEALGVSSDLVLRIGEVPSPTPRLKEMFLPPRDLAAALIEAPLLLNDASRHRALYEAYG